MVFIGNMSQNRVRWRLEEIGDSTDGDVRKRKSIIISIKKVPQGGMETPLKRIHTINHNQRFRQRIPQFYHSDRKESLSNVKPTSFMGEFEDMTPSI